MCQVALATCHPAHYSREGEWIKSLCSPGVWSEFIFISIFCALMIAPIALVFAPFMVSRHGKPMLLLFTVLRGLFALSFLLKIYKDECDRSCAGISSTWVVSSFAGINICRVYLYLDIGSLFILRNYYHLGNFIICRNQYLQGLPLSRYGKSLIILMWVVFVPIFII